MTAVPGRRGLVKAGLLLAALAPMVAAAACTAAPPAKAATAHAAAATALSDERITLPLGTSLSFATPRSTNRTEHQVLYTARQAERARLHAQSGSGASDPLLPDYWSGGALSQVRSDLTKSGGQAQHGVLAVWKVAYTRPDASGHAVVSFCASWLQTVQPKPVHVKGATHNKQPVAPTHASPGTYTTLTLTRASKHGAWLVSQMTEAAHSKKCAASK